MYIKCPLLKRVLFGVLVVMVTTHEHRHRGMVEHIVAHAAQERAPELAHAARADDDERGVDLLCRLDDAFPWGLRVDTLHRPVNLGTINT